MARHGRTPADRTGKHSSVAASAQLRTVIAQAAARLIAEGLTDHHAAKLKAARQLGVSDSRALPDNREIEDALVQHLALFEGQTQPRVLTALRETSLRLMRRLDEFSPALTGAVLSGTANQFSEIELDIVGTTAKDFEIYLLNAGVEFTLSTRPSSAAAQATPLSYACEFDGAPVLITLYENISARNAAHPRGSIRHERAPYAEAERRFSGAAGKL